MGGLVECPNLTTRVLPPPTRPPKHPHRALRAKQQPLALRPGSTKKLLRRVKLPREFAVHRTGLPTPTSASSALPRPDHESLSPSPSLSPLLPGLASPMSRSASSRTTWEERVGQQPAARPTVDSPADWLMVFDTEFSPHMAVKVRTTRQIPVSGACLSRLSHQVVFVRVG